MTYILYAKVHDEAFFGKYRKDIAAHRMMIQKYGDDFEDNLFLSKLFSIELEKNNKEYEEFVKANALRVINRNKSNNKINLTDQQPTPTGDNS